MSEASHDTPWPFYGLLAVIGAFIVITTSFGFCDLLVRKRPKRGTYFWRLEILTRCPCLVLMVTVLVNIGFATLGFQASGWTVNVDREPENYMASSSEIQFEYDAFQLAQCRQGDAESRRLQRTSDRKSRRVQAADARVLLDVYYEASNGDNIFTAGALEEMRTFETQLMASPGYSSQCATGGDGVCLVPDSTVNIFFRFRSHV